MPRAPRSPSASLKRDLSAFHALCRGDEGEATETLASPALRASTWNPRYEAAWALFSAFLTSPLDPDEPAADVVSLEALFSLLPPRQEWLHYLGRFPEGEELAPYRDERIALVERYYAHAHPSRTMLSARSPGVEAHLFGPYHCLLCLRMLPALDPLREKRTLAAWSRKGEVVATTNLLARPFLVKFFEDAGYLRVAVQPEDKALVARLRLRAHFFFSSGARLAGAVAYPDHALLGANLGRLPASLAEVIAFELESLQEI